jgi:hypothetical protein
MHSHPKSRGLFVVVRRVGDNKDSFKYEIHRRRTPFGVRLSEGGFRSYDAAHAAGTKVLTELLEQIEKEEAGD